MARALQYMGIADWEQKMIGLGFDWCSGGKRALRFTSAEAASVGSSFLVLSSQELSLKDAPFSMSSSFRFIMCSAGSSKTLKNLFQCSPPSGLLCV